MFSIDDFLEKIQPLPLQINRQLALIQELDRRAMIAKEAMELLQEELRQSIRLSPPPPPTKKGTVSFSGEQKRIIEKLDKAQTEYYHLSEEKCKIASQIFTEIQNQHEELQNEAKRDHNLPNNNQGKDPTQSLHIENISHSQKKLRKIEEKRANHIRNLTENNDDYEGSPNKQLIFKEMNQQASSLNSSIYEGSSAFAMNHQHHNIIDQSEGLQENGVHSKITNKRNTASKYSRHNVCCKNEGGEQMMCDNCQNWYHQACVNEKPSFENSWFCKKCRGSFIGEDNNEKYTPKKSLRTSSIGMKKQQKLANN